MAKCNKQQFWNSLTDEEKQIMREGKKIFNWEWCPYEYEDTGEIIRDGKVIKSSVKSHLFTVEI